MMTTQNNPVPDPSPDDEPTEPIVLHVESKDAGSTVSRPFQRTAAYQRSMILLLVMAIIMLRLAGATETSSRSMPTIFVTPAVSGSTHTRGQAVDFNVLMTQINPPTGYTLTARLGNLGPRLLRAGAIDASTFIQVYQNAGRPLTNEQAAILSNGSDNPLVIDSTNAYFLLNFFWAAGLTNHNPILTQMMARYGSDTGNFASTGGWSLGAKQPMQLYDSESFITLNSDQQARLEVVANGVFRPCCANHTAFPDCNHGMAMLGLLELMASQGASLDEMYHAAKYVNAFWFPQQALEIATYLKASQNVDFANADPQTVVGEAYFSARGFAAVHRWLTSNNLLPQLSNSGNSCGVS